MQIGRKNVHGKGGVRFKTPYTSSKQKAQVRNLCTELVIFEKVTVTRSMTKDVVKTFDRLVTYAKKGDLHSRRLAASVLRKYNLANDVDALDKLFNDLAKRFFGLLDRRDFISEILDNDSDFNVYIGNEENGLKDFSIVTFRNKVAGKDLGTIGIIGPTRMDYSKVISVLKYINKELNKGIGDGKNN